MVTAGTSESGLLVPFFPTHVPLITLVAFITLVALPELPSVVCGKRMHSDEGGT